MKQITADLQRLVKADPGRHYEVKIMATNKDVEVGFQYDGKGMYRALQINPSSHKSIAMTPWVSSLTLLERAVATEGLKLAEQRRQRPPRKSIFLYVDGEDVGVDVVDVALAANKTVDDVKRELEQRLAPAQVTFKVETR